MLNRETEELEFKKTTSELKEGVISLASMLNKNGHGVLFFGVKNDGSIFGQQIGMNTTSDISKEIKNYLRPVVVPSISVEQIDEKQVVRIEVFGEDKPYCAYGRYYIRSDDEDLQMNNTQLEEFFINKNVDYSKWENELTEYGEEVIDEELLIKYINKGNEVGRIPFLYRDVSDTLTKLGLMKNGKLNNAGVFLFSKLKPWTLKLAIYPTDARISFIDSMIFRGNIFECIDAAYQYIAKNIRWRADIVGMTRVETPEIPMEAIREIVVNSFAHMRVNNSSFNEIYITPTRVHIYNPGFLVKGKSPIDFANGTNGPIARNPLINTVLYLNKTIESFGTGFGRVFSLCDKYAIDTKYGNNDFGFVFEFKRKLVDAISDPVSNPIKLSDTEKSVLDIILQNNRVNRSEIAEMIGVSEPTVQRVLKKLLDNNLIKRVGSKRYGHWEVIHNNVL
ncbi:MAG: putative DNA binding domain-containing protein [Erysipelotrichaceae bacterium]|nr:putative DNA binding domain-containing protein [Erysipelotrichaceae bacterium]